MSADALSRLQRTLEEILDLRKAEVDDMVLIADRFTKVAEMRIAFFEKLMLLTGGSFALSLTLMGSVRQHRSPGASTLGREV